MFARVFLCVSLFVFLSLKVLFMSYFILGTTDTSQPHTLVSGMQDRWSLICILVRIGNGLVKLCC